MANYDFHQLSPYDLELLVRDLLQAEWKKPIESFKIGRDKGIDLRYANGADHTIIQVKHYLKTGFDGLLRDLAKEKPKVDKLKPTRYVVATSVPLSPANKDAIVKIFGAEILALDDVIGQEKLNALLDSHKEIEQRHFKLWLASRAVLDKVLHNAELTRSEFKAQQVYEKAKRYVASNAYPTALQKLAEQRVVIIAGPPGVGKTTLADLVLYEHLEKGYQPVIIQTAIEQGEKLFQKGVHQIFYFDDFMGATFLGDRPGGMAAVHDQALLNFIAMVKATPTARLILTTREHVYSQALHHSERLRNSDLDDLRVFLHMPSYTLEQRARILYNHLYFSDLPEEYIDELLRDGFYLKIVKHKRFMPRLIEWLSSYRRLKNVPVGQYRQFVMGVLDDPLEVWDHAYHKELTDAGRSLLLTIHSMSGRAGANPLAARFAKIHQARSARYGFKAEPEDFRLAMREATNVFIKPTGQANFEVLDPSVLDLMNAVLRRAPENAVDVIIGAKSFEQIERVWGLATGEKGDSILHALSENGDSLAPIINGVGLIDRRRNFPDGSYGYSGPMFESRLRTTVEMAHKIGTKPYVDLVQPLYLRLMKELEAESTDINEAVELIRALEQAANVPDAAAMASAVRSRAIKAAKAGCRSDELRELITVVDTENPDSEEVKTLRDAFAMFQAEGFSDELGECRSREQFDGLDSDLELFRDHLKVDVDYLLGRVEEAREEFNNRAEEYADYMQDEWKERWRDERADDGHVNDMFGSLKADRG